MKRRANTRRPRAAEWTLPAFLLAGLCLAAGPAFVRVARAESPTEPPGPPPFNLNDKYPKNGNKAGVKPDGKADPAAGGNPAAAGRGGVPLAVLDFGSNVPGNPAMGRQIGDVVFAALSGEAGVRVVDRAAMNQTLAANGVGAAGPVKPAQGVKIGKLVGARVVVTGYAFVTGDRKVFITATLIGTDTGAFVPVTFQRSKDADPAELLLPLSDAVVERLRAAGPKLLGDKDALADPLPGLKAKLAGRPLPKVAVAAAKRSGGPAAAGPADPAVGAAIGGLLKDAGFAVVEGAEAEWEKAGVDVVVTYDAAADPAARAGSLVTRTAHVDLKAVTRKDGQTLFADSATTAGVDLDDRAAGKAASQKGGREVGIGLLQHWADTLPAADATPGEKAPEPTAK